jgi:hypothetical protein
MDFAAFPCEFERPAPVYNSLALSAFDSFHTYSFYRKYVLDFLQQTQDHAAPSTAALNLCIYLSQHDIIHTPHLAYYSSCKGFATQFSLSKRISTASCKHTYNAHCTTLSNNAISFQLGYLLALSKAWSQLMRAMHGNTPLPVRIPEHPFV